MRLFLSPPHQTGAEAEWLRAALDTNYLAPAGPLLDRLEEEIATRLGHRHALALNSATSALHLAIRHLRDTRPIHPNSGPPVILAASLSFIASVSPALHQGCEVWLIDVEEESWTMDPVLLARALRDATAEQRTVLAVIPTELYGQACDLDAIRGLCDPAGVPVLLDGAESLGVRYVGSARPWASVTSFNGNKIITASGGGMLVSDDEQLITHARKLAAQAREAEVHYEHAELGYNFRMSHLLAAVALCQLEALDDRVQRRREIFDLYRNELSDLPGVSWMPEARWNHCTRWLSVMRIHAETFGVTPEDIRLDLEEEDIESRPVWKPLHRQPALRGLRCYGGAVSDQLFREGLCLPSGSAMNDRDVVRVAGIIRKSRGQDSGS